ncbi:HAD family hydrolase [Spirosoma flavum]|uniref:HAD family hydrolase n=1 Tax=Spirosoma flavum TaxID=2048557 RepID=A0ABW6ALQ7_9BACT
MNENKNSKKMVLVDFDGTLIKIDSLKIVLFKRFSFLFIYSFLKILYKSFFTIYKINLSILKELLFEAMFSGQELNKFQYFCSDVSKELHKYNNAQLIHTIKELQKTGFEIYIVSASPVNWIRPWAEEQSFYNIIGTEIEVVKNVLTGKFSTPNCKGLEKVKRIKSAINLADYSEIIAYGNSKSDYPMFSIAHESFLVNGIKVIPFS